MHFDLATYEIADPRTIAHQAPGSIECFRQGYWIGQPFLLQGIFLTQGSNPGLLHQQADSVPSEPPRKLIEETIRTQEMPDLHTWGCKSQLSFNSLRGSQPLVCSLVLKSCSQCPVGCWFSILWAILTILKCLISHMQNPNHRQFLQTWAPPSPTNCPSNWREQESYNTHSLPACGGAPGHISARLLLRSHCPLTATLEKDRKRGEI